jgi:cell division protein FtsX
LTRAWLLRRLVRDLRRHAGVWAALAAAFAAAGLCAAGARLSTVAPAAAPPAPPPAHVVAYLKDDLPDSDVAELVRVLSQLPEVEAVRALSAREGLERLRAELGPRAAVLEGVGADLLFPSLEIASRSASASALAFRLRRLAGVADVDLVPAPAPVPRPSVESLGAAPSRAALVVAGLAALMALAAALGLLRVRLRDELAVLLTFGLTRAACARPALTLAATAGALGAALGLLGARTAASVWSGLALPPREWAAGVAVFAAVSLAAALTTLRAPEAARAR